ncbi:hypothetical protein GCM10009823_10770 [Brevibacterium salitolerans]|uniref:Uncharacterized protein n=1 Tax=Brevibacterium salitolerans TaxID=1403566 RepID=A0ABN2WHV8_9MICO
MRVRAIRRNQDCGAAASQAAKESVSRILPILRGHVRNGSLCDCPRPPLHQPGPAFRGGFRTGLHRAL